MIYTSSHSNFKLDNQRTVAISGNRGKDAGYVGECYPDLAPKLSFWKTWHDNIGIIPEEENNKYYIEEYYKQVLSKLNIDKVYNDLDGAVLLCYENYNEFCHRHIVAAWFELVLDRVIPEIIINDKITDVVEAPLYIKDYLQEIMINNLDMKGFSSLNALYLYNKGKELEEKGKDLKRLAYVNDFEYTKRLIKKK